MLTGIEWIIHQLVQEMTGNAVDRARDMDSVARWEEWDDELVQGVDKVLLDPPTTKKRGEGGRNCQPLNQKEVESQRWESAVLKNQWLNFSMYAKWMSE